MECQEFFQKKQFLYKIKGQIHPFVGNNLQFHFPGIDQQEDSYARIYSHYSDHLLPSLNPYPSLSLQELEQAMQDAEKAYLAWKNVHRQIVETIEKISFKNINYKKLN